MTGGRWALPDRLGSVLGTAGIAVGVVSAVVAAVFTLFPELRPDPRERAEATIKNLAVDEDVTQLGFYRRLGEVPQACTREQLGRRGTVFYIQVDAAGFKRSSVGLRWFTYDRGNNRRVPGVRSNNRETAVFRPTAPINRQIAQVWVPWPLVTGDYFVRFELYSGAVLRAFTDSRPFSVPPPLPDQYKGPWCKPLAQRGRGG